MLDTPGADAVVDDDDAVEEDVGAVVVEVVVEVVVVVEVEVALAGAAELTGNCDMDFCGCDCSGSGGTTPADVLGICDDEVDVVDVRLTAGDPAAAGEADSKSFGLDVCGDSKTFEFDFFFCCCC